MKKLFVLTSLLVVAGLLLTACGGTPATATEVPTNAPTTVPTEVPTAEPTAEPVTLTLWTVTNYTAGFQAIIPDFEQQYGVKVVLEEKNFGDTVTQLQSAGPIGQGPDLDVVQGDATGTLVSGGLLSPIDLGDKAADFIPGAIRGETVDGKLYGVPLEVSNVGLFWNTDLIQKAPTTWDEFEQTCKDVIAAGTQYCLLLQEGDSFGFFPVETSFGGYAFGFNPDGTYNPNDLGVDSYGTLQAAKWLDKMVKAGYIIAGTTWETAPTLFAEGKAAMYITGSWNIPTFKTAGTHYAIAPIPSGVQPAAPFMGVWGIAVNSFSKNQALAQAFLTEYWSTEAVQLKFFDALHIPIGYLPALAKITDPDILGLAAAGQYANPTPTLPEMSQYWTPTINAVTFIMDQTMDPVQAFQDAASQIRTLIAEGK
jgi:arabinogalactan oligomer / maltooligosaccharide transport system substrate-binding protein